MSASRKDFRFQGLCSSLVSFFQGAGAPAEDQGGAAAAAGGAGTGGVATAKDKHGTATAGGLRSGREGGAAGGAAPGCPRKGPPVSVTCPLCTGAYPSLQFHTFHHPLPPLRTWSKLKPGIRCVQLSLLLLPLQKDGYRKFIQALMSTHKGGGTVVDAEINKTQVLTSSSLQSNEEDRQTSKEVTMA